MAAPASSRSNPWYLLRVPDRTAKEQAYREFVKDLRSIRRIASAHDY
jgi:hypothetical protein